MFTAAIAAASGLWAMLTGKLKIVAVTAALTAAFFLGVFTTVGVQTVFEKLRHPFRDYAAFPTNDLGVKTFGWVRNNGSVNAVLGTLPNGGRFSAVARPLMQAGPKGDALLYQAWVKALGALPKAHNQQDVGCCVSEGYSEAVELLQAVENVQLGENQLYKTVSHSAIYGLARDRGHMLGNQDGLVGAYAAESVMKDGVVSCEDAGETNQTSGLAKKWGRTGVPVNIAKLAKERTVKAVALVESADEVRIALQNGYPVPVCSDQGFSMERDADGRCRPSGSWAHCMLICGYRSDKDQFCIIQSWGDNVPSGPTSLGQPDYSFWVDSRVVQHMVSQGDTFALSNFDGWPAQNIDWFARIQPKNGGRPDRVFANLALAW
jgi:hypothetical protein